ncbi:hypothetical protein CEXT_497441 [Caerostris extrusa]|uniref:Ubiquitin-like domain-containing protein n=1 Tax=Caerostris extrusa TaxID=172846 RepID=A0AAV4R5M0_CAEEX|nr:hypothetical protein CEXT_497441 [Caerostris extrusa]
MNVQFSLYIGDEDVIHTISLRVPENCTAAEVMELAEVEDQKIQLKCILGYCGMTSKVQEMTTCHRVCT